MPDIVFAVIKYTPLDNVEIFISNVPSLILFAGMVLVLPTISDTLKSFTDFISSANCNLMLFVAGLG